MPRLVDTKQASRKSVTASVSKAKLFPPPNNQDPTGFSKECWIPPRGGDVVVAGYKLSGGMLYVGRGLTSINGFGIEPALIDLSLPVNRPNPDRSGERMRYWPSYSSISPESRAAYLEWLANGRRDPNACIGYVFLYLYGLERRALLEAARSEKAKEDLPSILYEVEQLLHIYGGNDSFRGYATQLQDVLKMVVSGVNELKPPMERTGYDLPISLRVGIGRMIAAGKPVPADWALSWLLMHPETAIRTPVQRCTEEFGKLFRIRYAKEFGEGLHLKPHRSKLKITYQPSSSSFGGKVELNIDLPDISALTSPLSKLRNISDDCAADLDAFSRWVGRNPDAPKTIAAVALLPAELATSYDSDEVGVLWNWIGMMVGSEGCGVCRAEALLQKCSSFGSGKLAKSEAVLLAQLLEKGGYGIEPDVRFGGSPLTPEGTVVVFRLPLNAPTIASPQYASATLLLHLAVAIANADGSISNDEEKHLKEHLQRGLELNAAEQVRLSAYLDWLMNSETNLSGLRKRLDPLNVSQRSSIADFIISVAGADGQISPEEIRVLGKISPMLGIQAEEIYSRVHAMAAGATSNAQSSQNIAGPNAKDSGGYPIPSRPDPDASVQLDMNAVKAKLAESAQISAILGDIFSEEEAAAVVAAPAVKTSKGKISSPYDTLLLRLVERSAWTRTEFEGVSTECRLLPDGAFDSLNEAAFEHIGGPILEGEDPIYIDTNAARELLL